MALEIRRIITTFKMWILPTILIGNYMKGHYFATWFSRIRPYCRLAIPITFIGVFFKPKKLCSQVWSPMQALIWLKPHPCENVGLTNHANTLTHFFVAIYLFIQINKCYGLKWYDFIKFVNDYNNFSFPYFLFIPLSQMAQWMHKKVWMNACMP